ncbi:MAG: DegV family protein [Lachnospiraceae bacterium]|nr:DegV family protein [Lachnospiraceae bacterium]
MGNVKIWCDSTCDLSEEQIRRYNITEFPLNVVLGEETFLDGVNITTEEIYKWSDAHKATPKTSALTFGTIEQAVCESRDAGEEVIFIGISSKMSTTNNVVAMAAQELGHEKLHVYDSRNLSTGIGLQVLYAARLSEEGKSAQEILNALEARVDDVRASFIVDTLVYLARGGRCNSVAALFGSVIRLHPMIVVKDGAMGVGKKYRGSLKPVLVKYAKDMEEALLKADPTIVFITHSGCSKEEEQAVYDYLVSLNYFKEVCITHAGGVISSHCGPGTLGVLYYAK